MLAQLFGRFHRLLEEQRHELERVHNGLPQEVIVRDDVRVLGALGNDLRALDPGLQLVEGIEVVVAVAGLLVFREPVLVVAAVKPDVPCRGGYLGAGRNGLRKQRLYRCCRARSQLSEHVEAGLVPACMPQTCRSRPLLYSRFCPNQALNIY